VPSTTWKHDLADQFECAIRDAPPRKPIDYAEEDLTPAELT